MRKNKFLIGVLISLLLFNVAFAGNSSKEEEKAVEVRKNMSLNIEETVQLGLEKSIDLKVVRNEIDLSALKQDRTEYLSKKLEDGDKKIEKGKEELNKAEDLLDKGISPVDKEINLPDGSTIDIEAGKPIPDSIKDIVIPGMKEELKNRRGDLGAGKSLLIDSLQEAGISISENLSFDSLDSLNVDSTSNLMTTMADISYEVTNASYNIYKNQIAMLIQKNYYDVLKAQKMVEVKKKAMERAKKQYEFAKDSYDVGMKARDDMLLSDVYYKGTQIEYRKAQGDLENALIELKKNLNIPLDTNIELTDVLVDEREIPDLDEGLESGIKNRLEIKKTLGEVAIYDLNFEKIKKKYPDITYQYKEAKLLKDKARLGYDKAIKDVVSQVRQSYETLITVGDMLEKAKDMVERAQENVEIAEYKYKEGLGTDSTLLKKLDIEMAAGTIVEVLAAEENLSNVEEKVVEIMYSYNMAKVKYYNDAGKFIY
ncbi:TolC family protein [Maledivibacter halophilus]|uniref:Outer membrane protein n=1 Tax=Maledivibacter halophilus TaxID=36842 RepID=A0A1T5JZP7_9FIRM|nr:TolC family protein [Maledivibacter halophilus]SKC56765.1 Outer membrane protein [Maledivibacter halophilus]